MRKYNPKKIEPKWQRLWKKFLVFEPDFDNPKRPFYNLMMFPYPSAEGLHIGNMYAFVGSDIYGKFKKLQGYTLFEPIGLDGFGIHSENYALKINKHPKELAKITKRNFYRQLLKTGNGFSWSAKLETYDPKYYKWTQWLFLQLFKAGLAYKKRAPVNFCPSCKTVLADEQVVQGLCERCDTQVEVRFLEQWFLKITKYKEKLLENLKKLDWSEEVKTIQKNWIGKSEGTKIKFKIHNSDLEIEVFTTRIDTIYGATFIVLSPFHKIISNKFLKFGESVNKYIKRTTKDIKTKKLDEKTGVFSGYYAINPINNKKIPIYISDYVLAEYGTGAIMGVPAHDKRDFEFAKKYKIKIIKVIKPEKQKDKKLEVYEGEGKLINSEKFNGLHSKEARKKILKFLEKKGLAKKAILYHLRDWLISRQRYWGPPIPIIYCNNCFTKIKNVKQYVEGVDYVYINKKGYKIIPVPEKNLPVKLPYIKNFRPLGKGHSPLSMHKKFYETTCPVCKSKAIRETDVSDTFLDSSWYFIGYLLKAKNWKLKIGNKEFKNLAKKWLPVDMYIGGKEHAVLHLMYARFISMVLYDLRYIHFEEPFKKFRAHGLLISQGAKMSKSRGNVIIPDEYIKKYGADTLRMYLMFLGPFEKGGDFRDKGIKGIYRFLNRVFNLVMELKDKKLKKTGTKQLQKIMHKSIKKITEDIENLRYNTAISQLMIYLRHMEKSKENIGRENIKNFLIMLSPFSPHIAEELYQVINKKETKFSKIKKLNSIFEEKWPKYDKNLIKEDIFNLIVQINGKTKEIIKAKIGIEKDKAFNLAKNSKKIKKIIKGKKIKKIIFVKNKLINIVL